MLSVHFQAKLRAPFHFHNDTFVIFTVPFWLYNGDITKFLWVRLYRASPPQLFGRVGDRPHGVGAPMTATPASWVDQSSLSREGKWSGSDQGRNLRQIAAVDLSIRELTLDSSRAAAVIRGPATSSAKHRDARLTTDRRSWIQCQMLWSLENDFHLFD